MKTPHPEDVEGNLAYREWASLTDEDRERAINSMPHKMGGFMKTWGLLHFAEAIENICREKNHGGDE